MTRLRRVTIIVAGIATLAASSLAAWILWPLPPELRQPEPVPSIRLLDRHGVPLRNTRAQDGSRGGWIDLADIDAEILHAFLAAEDRRFFEHHGVDARAVARAFRDNLRARRIVSGASTLSMQTARLLRPAPRTWVGKLAQSLWALRLEAHLDKSRILETYLNRVPLGQGAIGIAAAAELYFGARATDVSLGQAAMLAGLAHLPSRENPMVAPGHARARRNAVLERMRTLGFVTADDAERAAREPVLAKGAAAPFAAPHFTTQLLLRHAHDAPGALRTTLDLELQRAVEAEVRHTVATLANRAAAQAAAVVIDNRSGDILAWVGSPDFFADSVGQVDMVVSRRQPGSALKPFLYGLAFDRGFTAASILPDVPRTYTTTTGPYRPQNYDRRFRGPVRIREALASSYNVPAVELASRIGTPALLETLRTAGFASLDRSPDHYGLGLALGNGEVTLLELANAYRGLANGGVWKPARWTRDAAELRVPVSSRRSSPALRRFMTAGAAVLVLDILQDPVARIPGFGQVTPLDLPFAAAAKTGTSRHFTDNWAVATTGAFTVAVWVGNFSGRPMQGVSGITGAGPLLHRTALVVAGRYPPGQLPATDRVEAAPVAICALSGLRATAECPSLVEWFLPGTAPERTDDWQSGGRTTLPPEYAEWLASHRPARAHGEARVRDASRPRILSPLDGDVLEVPPGLEPKYATLPLTASESGAMWQVDGRQFDGVRWRLSPGSHTITAEWPDGQRDSVRIRVIGR